MRKKKPSAADIVASNRKIFCDRSDNHMKVRKYEEALKGYTMALELNKTDVSALIARSKCYLLLGEASKALEDAEAALEEEPSNMKALYQKAESLYFLGQFEQSLMFFYRGLRSRPELVSLRLGVQKAREAIENTIGEPNQLKSSKRSFNNTPRSKHASSGNHKAKDQPLGLCHPPKSGDTKSGGKLLGELRVDKEYLQNLLGQLNLENTDDMCSSVINVASDACEFLRRREEFWRQQRPCTVLVNHVNMAADSMPPWL